MGELFGRRLHGKSGWLPVAVLFLAVGVRAQENAVPASVAKTETSALVYDVVSIKPNMSGGGSVRISIDNGAFAGMNVSLKMLLQNAYGIKPDLIFGLAGWAESSRFDVKAKVVDPDLVALKKLKEPYRKMLQTMLADRFKLKTHMETKVLPVYELVLAKDGPKFKEVVPESETNKDDKFNGVVRGGMSFYNSELEAHSVPITALANQLSQQLHRTVIDKTGLKGNYDLSLKWTPEDTSAALSGARTDTEDTAPSIFTALQEQLGLKLMPSKGPVETLVVDHVDMPTED